MIIASDFTLAFDSLTKAKDDLAILSIKFHDEGYHERSGRVSDMRQAIEDTESKLAALYEVTIK